jgi:hypothetical protein
VEIINYQSVRNKCARKICSPLIKYLLFFKLLLPLDTNSFQASAQDIEALPKQIEALQQ